MHNIINIIDKIQDSIFKFDLNDIHAEISELVNYIGNLTGKLNDCQIKTLNEILRYMSIGIQNQDYLLVADILQYELKQFVLKVENPVGGIIQ